MLSAKEWVLKNLSNIKLHAHLVKFIGDNNMNFDDAVNFHGHACPGLALGFRVAKLALKEMGLRAKPYNFSAAVPLARATLFLKIMANRFIPFLKDQIRKQSVFQSIGNRRRKTR
jgi:hypothetical protein